MQPAGVMAISEGWAGAGAETTVTGLCCRPHASRRAAEMKDRPSYKEARQQAQGTQGGAGRPYCLLLLGSTDLWFSQHLSKDPREALSEVSHRCQLSLPKVLLGESSCAEHP